MKLPEFKKNYDLIFITNQPSFYKVNLYNEISKKKSILVIYTYHLDSNRTKDFIGSDSKFDYIKLEGKTAISKSLKLVGILKAIKYQELLFSGWDNIPTWVAAFFTDKNKNSCVSESSCHESTTKGIKGILKRIYLKRITSAYVSGKAQKVVFDNLGFNGKYYITKGVGLFNYIPQPKYIERSEVKRFLFVGRFVEVKNLFFLINVFNELSNYELYLVGYGDQEDDLKELASNNIHFMGRVNNECLPPIYQQMDVFILPSKSEAWGLVVEEAFNNGLPVIVSDKVGCADEIVNSENGLIFHFDSEESLKESIRKISDINFYNQLRKNIAKMDFLKVAQEQVNKYIH